MKTKRTPRRRQRHAAASAAEAQARRLMPIRKRGGKWFVDVHRYTPDMPEWGDYDTRREAEDDRNGVIRTEGAQAVLALIEANSREERSESREQAGRSGVRGQRSVFDPALWTQ